MDENQRTKITLLNLGETSCDAHTFQMISDDGDLSEVMHRDSIFIEAKSNIVDKFFETLRLPWIFGKKVDKFEDKYAEQFSAQKAKFIKWLVYLNSRNESLAVPLEGAFTKLIFKPKAPKMGKKKKTTYKVRKQLAARLKKKSKEGTLIPDYDPSKMKFKCDQLCRVFSSFLSFHVLICDCSFLIRIEKWT